MKSLQEVLDNYKDYKTFMTDRFGARLCSYLTKEQMDLIGFELKESITDHKPLEWSRENILNQLKRDVYFGWEKAVNKRGISSELMFNVVMSWNKVLEESLEDWNTGNYGPYGKPLFIATAKKYDWELPEEEEEEEDFE